MSWKRDDLELLICHPKVPPSIAIAMVFTIVIIPRLLCLQGTRRSFKYFPKNALLSFCCNMPSTCHVQGDIVLLCPDSHARSQNFSVINPNVLLQDFLHVMVRYLISYHRTSYRRLCVHTCMSSPLHHLSSSPEVCLCVSKHLSVSFHFLAPHFQLPLFVLHPLFYY